MDKQNNIELINNESKRIINEIDRIENNIHLKRVDFQNINLILLKNITYPNIVL